MKLSKSMKNNICYIYLPEIWDSNENSVNNCLEIISYYAKDLIMFFEFYREYGGIRVDTDISRYRTAIPEYFQKNGAFETRYYNYKKNKMDSDSKKFAIGKLLLNKKVLGMIPFFCDYYLETMMFVPNSNYSWEQFALHFSKNPCERKIEYLLNARCTDMVFTKTDGGDFSIIFNMNVFDVIDVENVIMSTFVEYKWS